MDRICARRLPLVPHPVWVAGGEQAVLPKVYNEPAGIVPVVCREE